MFSCLSMSRSGCLSSTPWILYTRVRLGRKCDTRNLARFVFVYETIKSRQLGLWLGLNCTLGWNADTVVLAYKFHPYLEIILFSLPYNDDPTVDKIVTRKTEKGRKLYMYRNHKHHFIYTETEYEFYEPCLLELS